MKELAQATQLLVRLSLAGIFIGILLKMMHWPYHGLVLVVAGISTACFYTLRFALKTPRRLLDAARWLFVMGWSTNLLFITQHWPYSGTVMTVAQCFGLFWLVIEGIHYFNNGSPVSRKSVIIHVVYAICALMVIAGALFKLMHWPSADAMLIVGLGLLSVLVIVQLFVSRTSKDSSSSNDR